MDSLQFPHEEYLRDTSTHAHFSRPMDFSKPVQNLSAEQLQQIAHAISMMNQNHASGNSNAYANVAGLFTFLNTSINYVFTKPWILDSGATYYIIFDPTLFTLTKASSIPSIILPIGSSASITSTGTIPFNSDITLSICPLLSFKLDVCKQTYLRTKLLCELVSKFLFLAGLGYGKDDWLG